MKLLCANIQKSIQTCCYFYKLVIKEKRIYPLIILLNILVASFTPFINIVVPKYIIDELMGGQDKAVILLDIFIIVTGNFLAAMSIRILQEIREVQEDMLSGRFEIWMAEKAMNMKFEYTEEEKSPFRKTEGRNGDVLVFRRNQGDV